MSISSRSVLAGDAQHLACCPRPVLLGPGLPTPIVGGHFLPHSPQTRTLLRASFLGECLPGVSQFDRYFCRVAHSDQCPEENDRKLEPFSVPGIKRDTCCDRQSRERDVGRKLGQVVEDANGERLIVAEGRVPLLDAFLEEVAQDLGRAPGEKVVEKLTARLPVPLITHGTDGTLTSANPRSTLSGRAPCSPERRLCRDCALGTA